jgi:hypothetical protein
MVDAQWGSRHKVLTERLAVLPAVIRADVGTGEEAGTLAHALLDIDLICRRVAHDVMPRVLESGTSEEALTDALVELGEYFREFLYHLRDPRFYRYLPGCEDGNTE